MSYLGVDFKEWRNIIIKSEYEYRKKPVKGFYCQLCKDNFKNKTSHKKSWKHKVNWNNYEEKRYDYILKERENEREKEC